MTPGHVERSVFVSRPTWVPGPYEKGVQAFLRVLEDRGLHARTLGTTDYPLRCPLDEVIKILDQCVGAIVLGLPQIVVEAGSVKGQAISQPLHLSTEWNQIEAALAYARRLPLLVIHHRSVSRGVFDRGALPSFLHEIDLADHAWPLSNSIHGALGEWMSVLAAAPSRPPDHAQHASDLPPPAKIEGWRAALAAFDHDKGRFTTSVAYSELRPYLPKELVSKLEAPRTFIVAPEARGEPFIKHAILDELAKLEREARKAAQDGL